MSRHDSDGAKTIARPRGTLAQRCDEAEIDTSRAGFHSTRRGFLTLLASLGASASLAACRRPEETIVPYVRTPEALARGGALHFATTLAQLDNAFGVIVESHDSHPTKLEGNPLHPESAGATTAFLQAALFDLYDPERSRGPRQHGQACGWNEAAPMLSELGRDLARTRGRDFAILMNGDRSPTTAAALDALRQVAPEMRVVRYEPCDATNARDGARLALGHSYELLHGWRDAERILVLDGDPLGWEYGPLRAAQDWSARRGNGSAATNRLYVIESTLSLTGSVADHRLVCASHEIGSLLAQLAVLLIERHGAIVGQALGDALRHWGGSVVDPIWAKRLSVIAEDLAEYAGRAMIVVGNRQPPEVHALALLLNHALTNIGTTLTLTPPFSEDPSGFGAIRSLFDELSRGSVRQLLIVGCNPVMLEPAGVDVRRLLANAELSVHLGCYFDETAHACHWHVNLAHELESWSDAVARDGTASIVQPLVAPLWDGKTAAELLRSLLGQSPPAYELVRATWKTKAAGGDFEALWRQTLLDGKGPTPQPRVSCPAPIEGPLLAVLTASQGRSGNLERGESRGEHGRAAQGQAGVEVAQGPLDTQLQPRDPATFFELVFVPSASAFDGRFANNGWLQELPDPITKTSWGNPVWISESLANRLALKDGSVLRLVVRERRLEVPVVIVPGQAENTLTIAVGQGHVALGKNANGIGVNAWLLHPLEAAGFVVIDALQNTGEVIPIARAQSHFRTEGRDVVRVHSATHDPQSLQRSGHSGVNTRLQPRQGANTLQGVATGASRAWGMAIDLSKCIGCEACVIACQAENNGPFVGRDAILRGRDMHWLRVDRYFESEGDALVVTTQPIPCQHCENAPCETVCPAGATAHSPDGLNDMVYNRCVGSRYCANNCPFKVRKFNFFEHNAQLSDTEKLRMNPNVSVRSRGVMEKCTFCVQRINKATSASKQRDQDRVADGAVVTACEQACPTRAIVFGDLNEPTSRVAAMRRSPRAYRLLDPLGLEPRVHYLAGVRNAHPQL